MKEILAIIFWKDANRTLDLAQHSQQILDRNSKFSHLQLVTMAIKPFEQVYPGQNSAIVKPKKDGDQKDWERKQRLKEYRIAARREKRNRKSDEKKQRKLNATILRRMVCLEKHY